MATRWLVEVAKGYREDVGPFEDVGAETVAVESGCLVFRNESGEVVFIRAAGTWITALPEED